VTLDGAFSLEFSIENSQDPQNTSKAPQPSLLKATPSHTQSIIKMVKIADLAVKYKDQPNAHLLSLRSIRPHPGMLQRAEKTPATIPRHSSKSALAQETRWLDIFLVTVRVLLSFDLELVPVGNNTTSRRAAKFLEVAAKDMGYDQEED
jgi:hypothetical protein